MTASILDLGAFREERAERTAQAANDILAVKQPIDGREGVAGLVARYETRWADHRENNRSEVGGALLEESLTVGGKPARLQNISKGGLMAQADCALGIGASLLVHFKGCHKVFGKLVWKRGDLVGIEVPTEAMGLGFAR
jgi:hypothetical protein